MKIAVNYQVKDMSGREWIDYAVSCGFLCMEIAAQNLPEDSVLQDEIIEYAKEKGLQISLHSHFGPNNITDTNEENRQRSVLQLKNAIDIAERHDLKVVTFHPGRLSDENENAEEKWELLLKTVGEIAGYAKEKKVYIGIENMEKRANEIVYTIDDLNRFAAFGTDNPYFGVTLDFSHFATCGIILPDLNELQLPIHDVHISQSIGGKSHFSLTEQGEVMVDEVCRKLNDYGYDGFIVLEVREKQNESKDVLERIINK